MKRFKAMKITHRQLRQIIKEQVSGTARKVAKTATKHGTDPGIEKIQRKLIRALKFSGYKIDWKADSGPGDAENPGGTTIGAEHTEGTKIKIYIYPGLEPGAPWPQK